MNDKVQIIRLWLLIAAATVAFLLWPQAWLAPLILAPAMVRCFCCSACAYCSANYHTSYQVVTTGFTSVAFGCTFCSADYNGTYVLSEVIPSPSVGYCLWSLNMGGRCLGSTGNVAKYAVLWKDSAGDLGFAFSAFNVRGNDGIGNFLLHTGTPTDCGYSSTTVTHVAGTDLCGAPAKTCTVTGL